MDESDSSAIRARTDSRLYSVHSIGFGALKRHIQFACPEADMVNSGSPTCEVPGDGGVLVRRFKEFDPTRRIAEEYDADMFRRNFEFVGRVLSEKSSEGRNCLSKGIDGDSYVVDTVH